MLCSPGQEVIPGRPIAEVHAPRKVLAVALKHLEGAAVGDQIPAGTIVGGEGGWRRRRQQLDWDARVVALNPAGGFAFLSGPEVRWEIKARIGGVVGPVESGHFVEITGEGLAMYCPIARGPSVFGTLVLHGGDDGEPRADFADLPDATVMVVNGNFDPGELNAPGAENLAGLLLPGMPDSWLVDEPAVADSKDPSGPAAITYGVIEAVASSALPESLWSVLAAFSGCPVSLDVDPDTGTGEIVVSGSPGDAEFDCAMVRGFGSDGIVAGLRGDDADGLSVRIAGGRLLAGVRVLAGQDTHVLAAANVEQIISKSAGGTGCD